MEDKKSKVMKIGKKVGGFIKRNGKKILVSAGVFVLGVLAGAKASKEKDDGRTNEIGVNRDAQTKASAEENLSEDEIFDTEIDDEEESEEE